MSRTVLITGAAVRIGRAITEGLARVGWDVVVHARRSIGQADALCARLRADGVRAWRIGGDLAVTDGPDAVFDAALSACGALDALVNNAAVFARGPLAGTPPSLFDDLWRVNALAPIRLTQLFAAHVAARGVRGAVVNLLDQRVACAGSVGATPYWVSKKALEAFTLSAAGELAPSVRVNAVAPGAVLPPPESGSGEQAGDIPLGARPTSEQVADAVRFLLEADAVTGQILFVDGGQHLAPWARTSFRPTLNPTKEKL